MFEGYNENPIKIAKARYYQSENSNSRFRTRPTNKIPNIMDRFRQKGRKRKLEELRNYVWEIGLLHRIIKMKVDFIAAGFEIVHEEDGVEEFYNEIYKELNIEEFIKNAAFEHEVIGEWYPYIGWNGEKPTMLTILDPKLVEVKSLMGRDIIFLHPSNTIQDLIMREDRDINARLLNHIPRRFRDAWKNGEPVMLDEQEGRRYTNLKAYHEKYAHSPLEPVIPDLEVLQTLISGDYSVATKIKNAILHIKIGDKDYNDGEPVDGDLIDKVEKIFKRPSQAMELFTQWFISHDWIAPDTDIFDSSKYESVYRRILDWSGLDVMIGEEGGGYARSYVKIKGFKQDVISARKTIRSFLNDLNIMIAERAEKRTYGGRLKVPEIKFSTTALKDDEDILNIVQFLYKHGMLSAEDTLDAFDYDFKAQIRKKEQEEENYETMRIPFEPSQGLLGNDTNNNPADPESNNQMPRE